MAWLPLAAQNNDCARNYSLYKEFMNVGSYDLATEHFWNVANECPGFRKSLYTDGVKIYAELISRAGDSASVYPMLDTIKSLYDSRVAYDGDKCGACHYYTAWMLRFRIMGKVSVGKFLDEIMPCVEYLSQNSCTTATRTALATYFTKAKDDLRTVNSLLEKRYSMPDSLDDCRGLMSVLEMVGARHNALYLQLMERVFESEPDFRMSAGIAGLCREMGLASKAMRYYGEAVRLAKVFESSCTDSSDCGRGYLAIAGIYLNNASNFGLDAFETSQIYWVSADYALKARALGHGGEADKIIAVCRARYPKKEDAFMHLVKPGDKVVIKLFGTEATTARF